MLSIRYLGLGNIQGDNISIPPRLKELHSRLVGITTEYQNLLDMFLSFFNSLQEVCFLHTIL